MSCVPCHVLWVTCHLSLTLTATDQTLPLLTPPICIVGWFAKTPTPQKKSKRKKSLKQQELKHVHRYANISKTLYDKKSPVHGEAGFRNGTDRQTDRHMTNGHRDIETESVQWANSVKMGPEIVLLPLIPYQSRAHSLLNIYKRRNSHTNEPKLKYEITSIW